MSERTCFHLNYLGLHLNYIYVYFLKKLSDWLIKNENFV
jgi:hypothetical protein